MSEVQFSAHVTVLRRPPKPMPDSWEAWVIRARWKLMIEAARQRSVPTTTPKKQKRFVPKDWKEWAKWQSRKLARKARAARRSSRQK